MAPVDIAHDGFKGYWQAVHEEGCEVAWQFDEYDLFTFACDRNLFWHDGKEVPVEVRIAADRALESMSLERWQLRGFDCNSPVADPDFTDPERDQRRRDAIVPDGWSAVPALPIPTWRVDSRRGRRRSSPASCSTRPSALR